MKSLHIRVLPYVEYSSASRRNNLESHFLRLLLLSYNKRVQRMIKSRSGTSAKDATARIQTALADLY